MIYISYVIFNTIIMNIIKNDNCPYTSYDYFNKEDCNFKLREVQVGAYNRIDDLFPNLI